MIARIIYAIGGIIVTLCGLRLLLVLLGANAANPFVNFIYQASLPFVRPFFGIFSYDPTYGASRFELATLIAIIVYAAITGILVRILSPRHSTV